MVEKKQISRQLLSKIFLAFLVFQNALTPTSNEFSQDSTHIWADTRNRISTTHCSITIGAQKPLLYYVIWLFPKSHGLFPVKHYLPKTMHGLLSASGPSQTLPTVKPMKQEQSWEKKEPENINSYQCAIVHHTDYLVVWISFWCIPVQPVFSLRESEWSYFQPLVTGKKWIWAMKADKHACI